MDSSDHNPSAPASQEFPSKTSEFFRKKTYEEVMATAKLRGVKSPAKANALEAEALIAAGLPPDTAAAVVAKTASTRQDAIAANDYRLKLINSGMGADQAKQAADRAAQFMSTPTPVAKSTPPRAGFQPIGTLFGQSEPPPPVPKVALKPEIIQVIQTYDYSIATTVTAKQQKLIDIGAKIAGTKPDEFGSVMAFTHSVLCQVGLPRSKTNGLTEFMRKSGDIWINVQAGWLDEGMGPIRQSLPYGPMPRLALAWVSTYAVRNKTREIPIGKSAAEFLKLMGMESEGRRYATLREQMYALAACRLQFGLKGRTYNSQPIQQFDAWQARGNTEKSTWPGVMLLSEDYFASLMEAAVPLDNRALHALKGSALALDVYTWLAQRLHRIEGRPVILHWKSLREQFAQEYQGKNPDKDFKKEFLPVLSDVLTVYPAAKVKQVRGGLMLMFSPPPIPKK